MGVLFVEPAIVPDVFITGVAEPEQLGDGLLRYTSFARQKSFHSGETEYVIVNRVIVPVPAVIVSVRQTVKALNLTCFCRAHLKLVH